MQKLKNVIESDSQSYSTIEPFTKCYNHKMKSPDSNKHALELLLEGGVGVMPTDTLYGLVAQASNELAVARLYKFKNREHKPGTVIAAKVEQLVDLGVPKRYLTAVEHFWPNPLSIVLPLGERLKYLHQNAGSLPFRLVADETLCNFLRKTGPLLTTSANHPDLPCSNNIQQAQAYFSDSVDFYVDGGDLSGRAPSTIIKIVDDSIVVLREGAVDVSELEGLGVGAER